jgi:hypothetical protein
VLLPLAAPDSPRKGPRIDEAVTLWVEHPFATPVEGKRPKLVLVQALADIAEQRASMPA